MPIGAWVGRDAIRLARRACLYDYLLAKHLGEVAKEGDSLRPARDHSVSIKRGYSGFTDFADYSTGNAVEYLMGGSAHLFSMDDTISADGVQDAVGDCGQCSHNECSACGHYGGEAYDYDENCGRCWSRSSWTIPTSCWPAPGNTSRP